MSGPVVMPGYWQDELATQAAFRNGWLHTGDLGYLDDEGDLWIVQRRTDMIISGGENVYPAEVEAVISQHPAVAEVCVVGIPDAEWGQRVVSAVVLKDESCVTQECLMEFVRLHLAGYKTPRQILFVERLPLTASGKVARREVVELCLKRMELTGEIHVP